MSTFKLEKLNILSANLGAESSLPPIAVKLSLGDISNDCILDEGEGLFVNYGGVESAYPYRYQDLYDRKLIPMEYDSIVLENEYLKATFIPTFGGKLWSLIDKVTGKELLFKNSVVRPCNLAVRNAWLSGGIEWNACFKGHNPFTCSLINTAKTTLKDGTPVLRFYYFERIRVAVVQMDFFLPKNAKMLYVRTRITNPNDEVIPMYWWSNVGAVQKDGDRVVVPVQQSYTVNLDNQPIKISVPVYNGVDVTYPAANLTSNDFFWTIEEGKRHYIAQLDTEGYGLFQTSTSKLQGRKMFVWGNSQGGAKWMNFLTADDESGAYDEIQCGLARTQYECVPMPPKTVWEWMEVYGALNADKDLVHGEWEDAQKEVERVLNGLVTEKELNDLLADTREMAKSPAEEILFSMNDGWGRLELLRRKVAGGGSLMNEHLDFGEIQPSQTTWIRLMEEGTVGEHSEKEVPVSYNRQKEWLQMLERAIENKDKANWYAYYLLGTALIANEEYTRAEKLIKKSIALCNCAWNNYALAIIYRKTQRRNLETKHILLAYKMRDNDVSLAKEALRTMYENGESKKALELYESASEEIKANKRCLLYYAYALARLGRVKEADEILCGKDGKTYMVVPDIRECELTETQLWFYIQELKGLKPSEIGEPPKDLDFRMFTKREGWLE
jgi:tetratricopeptide (TPR) repeat protein